MKNDLICLLRARYPAIFTEECSAPSCGDGWFALVTSLCERLQFATDNRRPPQVVARQVKEKLGTMRFYVTPGISQEQEGMIGMASVMSARDREVCGDPSAQMDPMPLSTRCAAHRWLGAGGLSLPSYMRLGKTAAGVQGPSCEIRIPHVFLETPVCLHPSAVPHFRFFAPPPCGLP
jgi:hypothetical protein